MKLPFSQKTWFLRIAVIFVAIVFNGCKSKSESTPLSAKHQDSLIAVVKLLNDSAWANRKFDNTNSFSLVNEALRLSANDPVLFEENVRARLYQASLFSYDRNYEKSFNILKELIDIPNISNNLKGAIYHEIGVLWLRQGLLEKAVQFYKKAEAFYESSQNINRAAHECNVIADAYMYHRNYTSSIYFLNKAVQLAASLNDKSLLSIIYNTFGEVYQRTGNTKLSLYYLKKSVTLLKEEPYNYSALYVGLEIVIESAKSADLSTALDYLNKSKPHITSKDGNLYLKYLEASYYYNKAVGKRDKALQYLERKDSLQDYFKMLARNNVDIKERIKFFENENDKKNKISQLKSEQRSTNFLFIIASSVGVAAIIFIFLIRKTKANEELAKQKLLIEEQNSRILQQSADLEIKHHEVKEINEELLSNMEELKSTQQQLVYSEKMASLGQLTAGIAHEINNPLNFISGGVQALNFSLIDLMEKKKAISEEEQLEREEEIKSLLKSITNGIGRAETIIQSLSAFSSPQRVINNQSIDVIECIESSLVLLNSQIKNNRIVIERAFDAVPKINAIFSQLSQVFVNITGNAIQALATTPDPKIIIEANVRGKNVIVKIRDNGPGIPDEYQNQIMSPFFTTKEVGKGTGLGLSISYGIIQKHQGELTFTSNAGNGTEFIISLPI